MTGSQRVRLEIYASKLKNVAGFGKGTSDPFAVVTQLAGDPREQPKVLGKTEVIKNSLSPRWTTHFDIDYEIGRLTRINIALFDEVRKGTNKQMGSAMFEVGEVLGSRGNTKAKKLSRGGTIFARITNAPTSSMGSLHLLLRGIKLKNVDGMFGKSDPFFEISSQIHQAGSATWQAVYRSNHVDNDLNPKWAPCSIDMGKLCSGDHSRPILVSVWDWEKSGKHQEMGSFETNVGGLISAVTSNGSSSDPKSVDLKKAFMLRRRGKEMGRVVVCEARADGTGGSGMAPTPASQVHFSTTVAESAPASVSAPATDVPAFGMALDVPPPSLSSTVAAVTAATAMSSMTSTQRPPESPAQPQPFVPSAPPASASPYSPGALPTPMAPPSFSSESPVLLKPNFVDYLSGGCELEMTVAIDFTGSNGDPRRPGTLHHIHPNGELNDYEKALTAIGSIIDRYDSDHKYPVYGFGAKYGGVIQHCFQVGPKDELDGIGAILEAYRGVFRTGLTMSGPTVFSECINFAAASARSRQEQAQRWGQQAYKVLLILTDGAVTSVEDTKRALDAASDAPLSVIIVGIGNADFSSMQFLDDFQVGGGARDICQFVEFNKYKHDKSLLTRETLDEVPDQLVEYFHSRGIKPLPAMASLNDSFCASEAGEEEINLNLDFSPEGEISLANYNNAVYDDSKYDTMATYQTPSRPFVPSAQPNGHAPQQQQPHVPYGQQHVQPPVAAQVPPEPQVFHVQVPPGVGPGTQLRVKNPRSGQDLIVTIPPGVASGGKFAVPL